MKLLTDSERAEITQAIQEAEKQTSCEFVVAEISQCDDYNSTTLLWGIIMALIVEITAFLLYPNSTLKLVAGEFIGLLVGFLVIGHIPSMKKLLVPKSKMYNEVHYRAEAEFYQNGLHETKEENGILIMLAVFERMVVILGDKGVNSKVAPDYWEAMKNKIIRGIEQKQTGKVITEAIKSSVDELKKHFPVKPGDKNELPDNVVTEK
jgi:putative membrane protein